MIEIASIALFLVSFGFVLGVMITEHKFRKQAMLIAEIEEAALEAKKRDEK